MKKVIIIIKMLKEKAYHIIQNQEYIIKIIMKINMI